MDRDASTVREAALAEAKRRNLHVTANQSLPVVRYFAQGDIFVEAFDFPTAEEKAKEYSRKQPSVPTYVVSPNPQHGVQRASNGELGWLPD